MSVCIAAVLHHGDDPEKSHDIIAIVDRKVSSVEFSNEDASIKNAWLAPNWMTMFAGNDISPVIPIVRRAREIIESRENRLEVFCEAMEKAYQEYLANLCHAKVLGRWKFKDVTEFREKGRKQFGADTFDMLLSQINEIRLRCTFLVCGVDKDKKGHIFTVSNPGIAEVRDDPGYWAIGNGSSAAMSLMSFFKQSVIRTLDETIYNVFTAKLMAETASDVGQQPFYWRINADGWDRDFPNRIFWDVRNEWGKDRKAVSSTEDSRNHQEVLRNGQ